MAALSFSTACGAKGEDADDDDSMAGTGGTAGGGSSGSGGSSGTTSAKMTLHGFDSAETTSLCPPPGTAEGCWAIQDYMPGDATYVNVFAGTDNADIRASNLTWNDGVGQDAMAGRLKFVIPFTDWNQLADIQINFTGNEKPSDFSNSILRSSIMLESGGSADASYPSGSYMFVKTGTEYVWAKGSSANLGSGMLGLWQTLNFALESPEQTDEANATYDPAAVVAMGIQVFSGGGTGDTGKPTEAVVYVDAFTLE